MDRALDGVRSTTDGRVLTICGDEAAAATHFEAGSQLVVYNTQHAVSHLMARLATALPHIPVHK